MARAPLGATVTLTVNSWDGERPVEGDFLRTETGRCYRIEFIRWRQRGARTVATFRCRVLEDDAVRFGEPGVWGWAWASRNRAA